MQQWLGRVGQRVHIQSQRPVVSRQSQGAAFQAHVGEPHDEGNREGMGSGQTVLGQFVGQRVDIAARLLEGIFDLVRAPLVIGGCPAF